MNDDLSQMVKALGGAGEVAALNQRLSDIVSLGGREKVAGMLAHFARQMQALLDTPDEALDRMTLHRIVGLAGILGFNAVDRAWRVLEEKAEPTPEDYAAARCSARAVVAFAGTWP